VLLLALEGARAFADAEEAVARGDLKAAKAAYLKLGDATEAQLVRHCRDHLADFKIPTRVHVVEHIPKGSTGKVQRTRLPQIFRGTA
jgi:acyl-coenzyme A synthetase/AMP-(fatty) acid ligase